MQISLSLLGQSGPLVSRTDIATFGCRDYGRSSEFLSQAVQILSWATYQFSSVNSIDCSKGQKGLCVWVKTILMFCGFTYSSFISGSINFSSLERKINRAENFFKCGIIFNVSKKKCLVKFLHTYGLENRVNCNETLILWDYRWLMWYAKKKNMTIFNK